MMDAAGTTYATKTGRSRGYVSVVERAPVQGVFGGERVMWDSLSRHNDTSRYCRRASKLISERGMLCFQNTIMYIRECRSGNFPRISVRRHETTTAKLFKFSVVASESREL